MSEMENIITDSIVNLLSTTAILLDVLLLKAILSNKRLKTYFYVVYGAYMIDSAIERLMFYITSFERCCLGGGGGGGDDEGQMENQFGSLLERGFRYQARRGDEQSIIK
uniref:Uncharacterized protein n=1 Tax=Romanomermis culicivorax TaxID=13658 RepID=A0A915HGP5_ROMCU